jgi:hypothetical protein
LTNEEKLNLDRVRLELEKNILLDEINWRKKSRALWLWEGDRNSKFYHNVANSHRRNNNIGTLLVDREQVFDPTIIPEHIVNF